MRPLQPSKHGGQLGAERDDDPAASTQSLNSIGCRSVTQAASQRCQSWATRTARFSKRIRDLTLLG
jgi:hypothetical protein